MNNGFLYATVLRYPEDGDVVIESLREADAATCRCSTGSSGMSMCWDLTRNWYSAATIRGCMSGVRSVGISGRVEDRDGLTVDQVSGIRKYQFLNKRRAFRSIDIELSHDRPIYIVNGIAETGV